MLSRRAALWTFAGALALPACAQAQAEERGEALERGIRWLLAQQAENGGWHSETYGALRLGAATTSLAIYALSHVPQSLLKREIDAALPRGLKFLEPGLRKRGFVACPDGSLDYPTYGTAMLATAALLRDFGLSEKEREKFVSWVVSGQLHESREFTERSPHYGGWDLMGASQVIGLTSDTNVSCTCFALEAIHVEREGSRVSKEVQAALARARPWAERCQHLRGDGGFWFSPDTSSINHKAGWKDDQMTEPKTYASATADGLRCLRYAAHGAEEDKHRTAAEAYLQKAAEVAHVPGFEEPDDPHGWALGLRFYYYQSLVKAIAPLQADWAKERRAAVRKQIEKLQQKDGRWQNESARMREDDPLIATALAIVALATLAGA